MKQKTDIEKLFRSHYEKMYRLARCMLYDPEECRDAVSEVFAKLIADGTVLLPERAEGYLMRSVRNRCINILARKSVKERAVRLLCSEAEVAETADENSRLDRVMQIVDRLEPPLRRRILQLRYLEELSYADIAREQGVSKVTVYNHLVQAMDFIREQFKEEARQ